MQIDGKWVGLGPGDSDPKIAQIKAFMRVKFKSYAGHLNDSPVYDHDLFVAVVEMQKRYGLRQPDHPLSGVLDYITQHKMGFLAPVIPPDRFPIQGVGHNTTAFLQPDPFHTFNEATDEGAVEALRLFNLNPSPTICIGYSMGGVTANKFLRLLPEDQRSQIKMLVTLGDPSMPAEGSLLGNDPGEGISRFPQPTWVRDRYYSYSLDGDWYPRARGLLFLLYDILTRAELTWEFATWLFTEFPSRAMQEIMGLTLSDDPLAGILAPLGDIARRVTGINELFMVLPNLLFLLFDAIKFAATNAHGMYADPQHANWDGLTAVDHAVRLIREKVPTARLFLFPGTWAMWDQGFPFDIAVRLQ